MTHDPGCFFSLFLIRSFEVSYILSPLIGAKQGPMCAHLLAPIVSTSLGDDDAGRDRLEAASPACQ